MEHTAPASPYGALKPIGARPRLREYLAEAWGFRQFGAELARQRLKATGKNTALGPLWLVATPLLNALMYYVVFGLFLRLDSTVANYPLFLLAGVLLYAFFRQGVSAAAGAIGNQADLVRTMPFPRVIPPTAAFGVELGRAGWSLAVLLPVALFAAGLHPSWLFAGVGLVGLAGITWGLGLLLARLYASFPDARNVTPFLLRGLAFLSGVYFPLSLTDSLPSPVSAVLEANPVAVALSIVRDGLMGAPPDWSMGAYLLACACLLVPAGVLAVWQGEPRYG